ncbi:hypothetical protein [Ottowia sp.]|uniref:hypothetical protein n=1 Tax=Ottowia sp. TaxID=1898956 RepID=UPI003A88A853
MKVFVGFFFLCFFPAAYAQWAVYDSKVDKQLQYINQVNPLGIQEVKLDRHYKSSLGEGGDKGTDLTLGDGESKTVFKSLDTKFDELTDLTDEQKESYIGTVQDCGDDKINSEHYKACVGLRNLRLQTLKQSQGMLKTLKFRREQIVSLVDRSRQLGKSGGGKAGELQRYQFELQAQQTLLQTDTMQLQVLMDGYKQREQVYTMQMHEARRASDSGSRDSQVKNTYKKAVPFISPAMLPF